MQKEPVSVLAYCGQKQTQKITVSGPKPPWEDGPRPGCYLGVSTPPTGFAVVPPPIAMTEIFKAQQTFPL